MKLWTCQGAIGNDTCTTGSWQKSSSEINKSSIIPVIRAVNPTAVKGVLHSINKSIPRLVHRGISGITITVK